MTEAPSGTLGALASEFVEQHKRLTEAEGEVGAIKARLNEIEPLLLEEMGGNGVQNMNVNGRTIYLRTDLFVNKPADVPADRLIEALRGAGLGHLVGESYNAAGLKSQVREWREEGAVPETILGLLNIVETTKAICRK